MDQHEVGAAGGGAATVDEQLARLSEAVAALEAQVTALTSREVRVDPPGCTPPSSPPEPRPAGVSRRGLVAGAVGAVAAGVVGAVATAAPAAANGQGQSLTLGDPSNTASTATGVTASFNDRAVFQAINTDTGATATALYARLGSSGGISAVSAVWGDAANSAGVAGTTATGTGVAGTSSGSGTGVAGTSATGTAVSGYSLDGTGVSAYSKRGAAALTASAGSTSGMAAMGTILADSANLMGVVGLSATKSGVYGAKGASSGMAIPAGVVGDASGDPGVVGLSATESGVVGISGAPSGLVASAAGVRADSYDGVGLFATSALATAAVVEGGAASIEPALSVLTFGSGPAARFYRGAGTGSNAAVEAIGGDGGPAMLARTTSSSGIAGTGACLGDSRALNGVAGRSATASGVYGIAAGPSGFSGVGGVVGESSTGYGACGFSTNKAGVRAASTKAEGVRATSTAGVGGSFSGGRAAINLTPTSTTGRPTSGAHSAGDLVVDRVGALFLCTVSGTPGTWVKVTVSPA